MMCLHRIAMSPEPSQARKLSVLAGLVLAVVAVCPSLAGSRDCFEDWSNADTTADRFTPTHSCINQIIEYLETLHPNRVRAFPIGESRLGRVIYALRVTVDPDSSDSFYRPSVLFTGGHHPTEAGVSRVLLEWVREVLQDEAEPIHGGSSLSLHNLLSNRQVWLVPLVSPDGYEGGGDPSGRWNSAGVNLARDYEFGWVPGLLDDTDGDGVGDHVAVAGRPLAEPETRAIDALASFSQPQIYLDVHGNRTTITGDDCGGGRATSDTRYNWEVVRAAEVLTWDSSDSTYSASTQRTPNDDAMRFVYRRQGSDPPHPDIEDLSLPALSEEYSVSAESSTDARYYSPYSNAYACDFEGWEDRGRQSGTKGQAFGHMWVKHGAISFLLEVLDEVADGHELLNLPGWGTQPTWLGRTTREGIVQQVLADTFAPLNRLVASAGNPIPDATLTGAATRHDLAVSALRAVDGSCDLLRTFWPIEGEDSASTRSGLSGTRELECRVTNHGNDASGGFDVTIEVQDLDSGVIESTTRTFSALIVGGEKSQFITHEFERGHRYDVVCEITPHSGSTPETDSPVVLVENDPGCASLCTSSLQCPDTCEWNSTTLLYDRRWQTNNRRSIRFEALEHQDALCPEGTWLPHNVNGAPTGHIAAVVLL